MRADVRKVICSLTRDNLEAANLLNRLLKEKIDYCMVNSVSVDIASSVQNEIQLFTELCQLEDIGWEPRLMLALQLFF